MPADRREPLRAEGLGRDHVGEGVDLLAAELREEVGVGVDREGHLLRAHAAAGRPQQEARARGDLQDRGVLVDGSARAQGEALLLAHEPGRVHEQEPRLEERAEIARRVDALAHRPGVDPVDAAEAQRLHQRHVVLEPADVGLGGRRAQEARADAVAVEPLARDQLAHGVDGALHVGVGVAHEAPASELRHRSEAETDHRHPEGAVASAGPVADLAGLEHGDAQARLGTPKLEGRHEAREAPAHDRHVHVEVALERRLRLVGPAHREPERER